MRLTAGACVFDLRRLSPGVLLVTIAGDDRGQFGTAVLDELDAEMARFGKPLLLFFDMRKAMGPSTPVMEMWTAWIANHRQKLRRIVLLVLPESKVLHLTLSIAQLLSRTGSLFRLCGDVDEFARMVRDEVPSFQLGA